MTISSFPATVCPSPTSLLDPLLAHAPVAVAGFDHDLVCSSGNPRFAALVGRDPADLPGLRLQELLPLDIASHATVRRVAARGTHGDEIELHRDQGQRRQVWRLQLYPLPQVGGGNGVGVVAEDVTAAVDRVEELTRRADVDALTGLLNREAFHRRLRQTAEQLARHRPGAHRPATLIVLDLDAFKDVNDRFGHLAGDAVLAEVGRRLRTGLRPSDVAGRLGGDEFAILSQGTGARRAEALARRVRDVVREPVRLADGTRLPVALTLGHSEVDPCLGALHAVAAADVAMYAAKRGRTMRPAQREDAARREGQTGSTGRAGW